MSGTVGALTHFHWLSGWAGVVETAQQCYCDWSERAGFAHNTLLLGDTTVSVAIGASSAATKLQVVGDIRVGTSGTNSCLQNFTFGYCGTCSYHVRLKKNTEPYSPVLDKLIQLQPSPTSGTPTNILNITFGCEL